MKRLFIYYIYYIYIIYILIILHMMFFHKELFYFWDKSSRVSRKRQML